MNLTYLYINLGSMLLPFLFSFEKRVAYYKKWKFLFPALTLTALLFLVWDHFFTVWGVWKFNPEYITGITIFSLPIEEILFFFAIPFASIFIYEAVNFYYPQNRFFNKYALTFTYFFLILALVIGILFYDRAYTAVNCGYAFIILAAQLLWVRPAYMGRFWRFYFIHLIPFFIVNGILTGSFIQDEVVWYNNMENMGVRLFTIPAEDVMYTLSLMLINITLYEYFKVKFK